MHIFVDLDGVLANFCQAACDLHSSGHMDYTIMEFGRARLPDGHPFQQLEAGLGVDMPTFWEGIQAAGSEFWENMPMLPAARELWDRLNEIHPEQVSILSSPGKYRNAGLSAKGKYNWVCDHLGEEAAYRTIICPAPRKHYLAKGNLLIDDMDLNVERWDAAGGHAIQWPSMQFHQRHATIADVDRAQQVVANLVGGAV